MSDRTNWLLDRTEAMGTAGMVAAKHPLAAEAGADVLRRGGNAIDAAVTTAFVVGVVEPFMSGLGGGGFLVAHLPGRDERVVVDYSMVAPRLASPAMYELASGTDMGLFGWPAVVDDGNIVGHRAVAVPGTVAGLALALERYGTIPLAEALAPAIRFAEEGFPVSWHTTLYVAIDLELINRFHATSAVFTRDGMPPSPLPGVATPLRQPDLAATMRAIAAEGPRVFYEGAVGEAIAREMRTHGGLLDEEDLIAYRARVVEPLGGLYRGHEVLATPTATGGPTVLETLNLMEQENLSRLGHNSIDALHVVAEASRQAFVDRFAYLADPEFVPVPTEQLTSTGYATIQWRGFAADRARATVPAGARSLLGVGHNLDSSEPGYGGDRMTTTHISVIDRDGNVVSLTQTLLSGWGSRVTVPGTGVLLNNGMMWFDPVPGRPNSVAGGKRPLANMAPVIVLRDGHGHLSLGAMGGRRILSALPQIASNVIDHGMGIQAAITAPRIDYSTRALHVSDRLALSIIEGLRQMGHPVVPAEEHMLSFEFASPVGVLNDSRRLYGGANPFYPAMAVGLS